MKPTSPVAETQPSPFHTLTAGLTDWTARLQAGLHRSVQASDQNLGHLEETLLHDTRQWQRNVLQEVAQKKADTAEPRCPHCGSRLTRRSKYHARTFETRFGPITVQRQRGWCRRCRKWRYPADRLLGLEDTAGYSPSVQEMAALAVSKLPVAEASAVIERLAGVKIPAATLFREARRQGQRAQRERQQMDQHLQTPEGQHKLAQALQLELPLEPYQFIIEIDAWNIRERDRWGESATLRAAGEEPSRWHGVYGATCFRLDHRGQTAGGRAMISERGYVMTREGIDGLREQLWAEAQRRGLGQAAGALVIADGAVWIWRLAEDRFPQARQRLDYYHATEHLWAVAEALHGAGTETARAWMAPLLKQLREGESVAVIEQLEALLETLPAGTQAEVSKEVEYLRSHRERMDYGVGREAGEPIGSGAMESTCRQYQCRFKRPGQFWSREGDEALMSVETFWRNGRWNVLFPHVGDFDPSKN